MGDNRIVELELERLKYEARELLIEWRKYYHYSLRQAAAILALSTKTVMLLERKEILPNPVQMQSIYNNCAELLGKSELPPIPKKPIKRRMPPREPAAGKALFDLDIEGVKELSYQIVRQAINDFINLRNGSESSAPDCNMAELKRFFCGEWFESLMPELDGKKLWKDLCDGEIKLRGEYGIRNGWH